MKHESILDILREMRTAIAVHNAWFLGNISTKKVSMFADRIEDALEREKEKIEADAMKAGALAEDLRRLKGANEINKVQVAALSERLENAQLAIRDVQFRIAESGIGEVKEWFHILEAGFNGVYKESHHD